MNYNQNNQCNNRKTCSECKNKYWVGEMVKLENWPEKGALCRDCLLKIKIPCRRCSKSFNKIENFSVWERGNYEQQEKVDRKKWEKEKPDEKCWPYIGCHFVGRSGGQFCHKADCHGHFVPSHGHFCSVDCYNEWNGTFDNNSPRYKEWKTQAEKLGWTPCQEKDLFRDWDNHPKLSFYKEKIRKEEGEHALACNRMAAPGEDYCFYCECEQKNKPWGDHRNNEKNWVKSYRDYWKITNDKNAWPNNEKGGLESSVSLASDNSKNDHQIEKLEKELIEAKRQRKSTQEIKKIQSELEKLSNQQLKGEVKPAENNNALIFGSIIIFSVLILGIIFISKSNKKKK